MISIEVKINDACIFYAEAVRIKGKGRHTRCTYRTGQGQILTHDYDEGFKPLVKRLLDVTKDMIID
jgi:hypothetical protein